MHSDGEKGAMQDGDTPVGMPLMRMHDHLTFSRLRRGRGKWPSWDRKVASVEVMWEEVALR